MPDVIQEEVVIVAVAEDSTNEHQNMRELARQVETHYTQPSPAATLPPVQAFPALMMWGLLLGAVLGGILGWIVGTLLHKGTIVISGAEGMFSMFPDAFMIFWIGMGVAFGSLVIGIIAQFVVPVPPHRIDNE